MKNADAKVEYRGEHLGIRVGADRCQAIIRDYGKKTWSTYGSPDSYPREQKYWTSVAGEYGIVRLAVQALRNEISSDLMEILTGAKSFSSAQGHEAPARLRNAPRQSAGDAPEVVKATPPDRSPIPIRARPVPVKAAL